jgi:hypothetical protein
VNALAAALAKNVFRVPAVHVADTRRHRMGHQATLELLGATDLFGGPVRVDDWDHRIDRGEIEQIEIPAATRRPAAEFYRALQAERPTLPLAVRSGHSVVAFHSGLTVQAGDAVVALRARYVPEPWHQPVGSQSDPAAILVSGLGSTILPTAFSASPL